jgi:hypothetical protein
MQKFAMNFEATQFLGGSFFSDATQAKVCNKFCGNSIFGRKFFSDATQFVRTNWSTYLLLTSGRKNIF